MRHLMPVLLVAGAIILNSGAAYADSGDQLAKLLPDDRPTGANTNFLLRFGSSVAISGTTAIVGALSDDQSPDGSGAAYLFDRTTGQRLFKFLSDGTSIFDGFGSSVAISGTTAIVGAKLDNADRSGSAYLFDTTSGRQLFKLLPAESAPDRLFGWSVAISGTTTAIVGAINFEPNGIGSGAAYLFDTTTGQQIGLLLPDHGPWDDDFGITVGISGATAIVGARSASAYLFDATTGQRVATLLADDHDVGDGFGLTVAISATTAIVGAYRDDGIGSAYLFDTTTGRQIRKLVPDDGAAGDGFGISVAIGGTNAIVGASGDDDNGRGSGSAYLFDGTTGRQIAKLLPDDGFAKDEFGNSVAISGSTAIVGALNNDDKGTDSGSAYLFDAAGEPGGEPDDEPDDDPSGGDTGEGSSSDGSDDGNNNDNSGSQDGTGDGDTSGGSTADGRTDSGEGDGERGTPTDTGATTPGPTTAACPTATAMMFVLVAVGLVRTRSRQRG